jgi:hypothetical protein
MSCGDVKLLTKASVQKAQSGPCNQLIKATSCIERLDAMIGAKDLNNFSSSQMLMMDKKWQSYLSPMKLIKLDSHDRP